MSFWGQLLSYTPASPGDAAIATAAAAHSLWHAGGGRTGSGSWRGQGHGDARLPAMGVVCDVVFDVAAPFVRRHLMSGRRRTQSYTRTHTNIHNCVCACVCIHTHTISPGMSEERDVDVHVYTHTHTHTHTNTQHTHTHTHTHLIWVGTETWMCSAVF